ncbi:GDP-mannose-dependent alpha-(1-6)-phosphatidylinositol monomannoside mannosyltransferase [Posidoniimonas polymericola]|uniref:GDP-mannose-dependent alpha-(1-6)-phosphatidylinositol monomannoside mannosyltransferase n=1 Tax=Posidoniimonas polymericola TaxID=2528002 RepID=A0A5C5XV38_9BACT|nr:glycosyltransferase family 4 protein [Posidoniimonas polymericola]TWT66263.1 GDP-mannose-dependent alpha-(1-6)-phosphatidylinositol monomannoside mannosyltransferase [Posidoniimonas polymericola]
MNSTTRIAYVLKRYPRFSETFVVNEILTHEAAGVEVDIFALRPPLDTRFQPEIALVKGPVSYLSSGGLRASHLWDCLRPVLESGDTRAFAIADALDAEGDEVYQALQLAESIRRRGVTHIHAHFATSATTVARLASLLTGVPYTFTAHAKDIFHEYVDAGALGQKVRDAARVITVSDFNVTHLTQTHPEHAEKVTRLYNGIRLSKYPFREAAERAPLVLAVGRLVEKKGFDDLIAACARIRDQGVMFRCEIIGDGDLGEKLEKQIRQSDLQDTVTLLGARSTDEVAARMREAAAFVMPCITASTGDRDGMPTVLLEAMATGAPCIGTTVTGIPELIEHEVTGLLHPERRPDLIADSIIRLLTDEALGRELAVAAREQIEREFDIEKNSVVQREIFQQTSTTAWSELAEAV